PKTSAAGTKQARRASEGPGSEPTSKHGTRFLSVPLPAGGCRGARGYNVRGGTPMIRTAWTLCVAAATLIFGASVAAQTPAPPPAAAKYKPGDRVVVIRDAELRLPTSTVADVSPGTVLKVSVVNDKWLW